MLWFLLGLQDEVREEMTTYIEPTEGQWTSGFNNGVNTCIEILDSLIESEDKKCQKENINHVAL